MSTFRLILRPFPRIRHPHNPRLKIRQYDYHVVLRGQFINVLLRLKGTKTASIEVHGMTYHKRVVRIVSISLYYEYCR